jgi:hypothetical protein
VGIFRDINGRVDHYEAQTKEVVRIEKSFASCLQQSRRADYLINTTIFGFVSGASRKMRQLR